MIIIDKSSSIYIKELTIGHESKAGSNAKRKAEKSSNLAYDKALGKNIK